MAVKRKISQPLGMGTTGLEELPKSLYITGLVHSNSTYPTIQISMMLTDTYKKIYLGLQNASFQTM